MSEVKCKCPRDSRRIPPERRVTLFTPPKPDPKDPRKLKHTAHVYDSECPMHGYKDITPEPTEVKEIE